MQAHRCKPLTRTAATCVALLTTLAACNGSDTASTTAATTTPGSNTVISEAPPTTPAPTTSAPPTTAAPTTAGPSTTAPADPTEAAKAEVAARYEEFSVAANECVAAGSECDLPTVLAEFSSPEADLYELYENRWLDLGSDELTRLDLVERSVAVVDAVDDTTIYLVGCVIDGSVLVDKNGDTVDDSVGYRREETFWSLEGEHWVLNGGNNYNVSQTDDQTCHF